MNARVHAQQYCRQPPQFVLLLFSAWRIADAIVIQV